MDDPQLERLAAVLRAKVTLDECREPMIRGRRARYVENGIYADGQGYSVMASYPTGRGWSAAKAKLTAFCQLRQDCDTEGVLYLSRLPTPEEAITLRKALGIKKRPTYAPEVLAAKRQSAEKARRSLTGKAPWRGEGASEGRGVHPGGLADETQKKARIGPFDPSLLYRGCRAGKNEGRASETGLWEARRRNMTTDEAIRVVRCVCAEEARRP